MNVSREFYRRILMRKTRPSKGSYLKVFYEKHICLFLEILYPTDVDKSLFYHKDFHRIGYIGHDFPLCGIPDTKNPPHPNESSHSTKVVLLTLVFQ